MSSRATAAAMQNPLKVQETRSEARRGAVRVSLSRAKRSGVMPRPSQTEMKSSIVTNPYGCGGGRRRKGEGRVLTSDTRCE